MDDKEFKKIVSKPSYYAVIVALRDGPLIEDQLINELTAQLKLDQKAKEAVLSELVNDKVIGKFKDKEKQYYILIKDFFVARIPPKNTLDFLQQKKDFSKEIKNEFFNSAKAFFSKYISSPSNLKPENEKFLLKTLLKEEMIYAITILRDKPLSIEEFKKRAPNAQIVLKELINSDFVEVHSERQAPQKSWVILKSDLNFQSFFPEYLTNTIAENLARKKIDKTIALKALYALKYHYLINYKPDLFDVLTDRINAKLNVVKDLEKSGQRPVDHAKELKKLYKNVGDYDNRKYWEHKLREWEKGAR